MRTPSLLDRTAAISWSTGPVALRRAPWVVITQLFFGLGWLRAFAEKAISIDWWTGTTIRSFVAEHEGLALPWIEPLLAVVDGVAPLMAALVLVLQLGVGLALVANRHVPRALLVAAGLNLVFLAAGAVAPSAFYLLGQGAVALWLVGRRPAEPGLSRWLRLATAVAVALAVISAPFITTLHPAQVIDDPAIMIVLLGGLTALACELTHRAVFGRSLP